MEPGLILLIIYLAAVNIFAVIVTIHDKNIAVKNGNAKKPKRRVPERTLLIVSAMGGSVAMLLTMLKIRHKTKHMKFMVGIPAIIAVQIALVVLLIVIF